MASKGFEEARRRCRIAATKAAKNLNLAGLGLTDLPKELALCTELETLRVSGNPLGTLPDLRGLSRLELLEAVRCGLAEIPEWVFEHKPFIDLDFGANSIRTIPAKIGELKRLQALVLAENPLEDLPNELGNLFLKLLEVDDCPLSAIPPEIITQGRKALLAYLRDRARRGTRQWTSKLLIVGQGGAGKTSLLRALRGEPFQEGESKTRGIDILDLKLPHPSRSDVIMGLKTWDFGGQEIYHATHQFFLTNRSLFLLVWNARQGFEQGRLFYWLDTIKARAPESPVLIVAAHADQHGADLPLADIKRKYPFVVGHHAVSNKTGKGVDELREALLAEASTLPLMGERWPSAWLAAANAIRAMAKKDTAIAPKTLWSTMKTYDVEEDRHPILASWMHELGDILFFQDKQELREVVLLDPHWATEAIGRVLDSDAVKVEKGIFTREEMSRLWSDIEPSMQRYLLGLMEQFDLSYRTKDDERDVCIIVECLPQDEPAEIRQVFDARPAKPSVSMRYVFEGILPAGIPTWFLAREHRFTTRNHYRRGAVFADGSEKQHIALIQADADRPTLRLSARGPLPFMFFALLRDGLEVTLRRFKGLQVTRLVPCPGHAGEACPQEFQLDQMEDRLKLGRTTYECPEAGRKAHITDPMIDVRAMLFGLTPSTSDAVLAKLEKISDKQDEQSMLLRDMSEHVQREFRRAYREAQSREDTHCPSFFVIRPVSGGAWKETFIGQDVELQLLCEAPAEVHPVGKAYRKTLQPEWLNSIAPYLSKFVKVLKYAVPLVAPVLGEAAKDASEFFKADLSLTNELVKKLPEIAKDDPGFTSYSEASGASQFVRVEGAELRALRILLEELDQKRHWGGLEKVQTKEGDYLWVCKHHKAEIQG